jgi:hypothetical protein
MKTYEIGLCQFQSEQKITASCDSPCKDHCFRLVSARLYQQRGGHSSHHHEQHLIAHDSTFQGNFIALLTVSLSLYYQPRNLFSIPGVYHLVNPFRKTFLVS